MAEDAGVLLVARRVRWRSRPARRGSRVNGGLLQHDAVRRVEPLLRPRRAPSCAWPSSTPMPAMTQKPCGSMKICASSFSLDADLVAEEVVGAQEPLAVPAVLERRRRPSSRPRPGLLRPRRRGRSCSARYGVVRRHADEQPGDEHRLGDAAVRLLGGLERLVRRLGEAVEVQAVVPVGAADERQAVRPEVVRACSGTSA